MFGLAFALSHIPLGTHVQPLALHVAAVFQPSCLLQSSTSKLAYLPLRLAVHARVRVCADLLPPGATRRHSIQNAASPPAVLKASWSHQHLVRQAVGQLAWLAVPARLLADQPRRRLPLMCGLRQRPDGAWRRASARAWVAVAAHVLLASAAAPLDSLEDAAGCSADGPNADGTRCLSSTRPAAAPLEEQVVRAHRQERHSSTALCTGCFSPATCIHVARVTEAMLEMVGCTASSILQVCQKLWKFHIG